MKYLDLTLPDPASNLACDEALLEMFETSGRSDALLRTWQSKSYFIVLGHANRIDSEIDLATCESEQVAILRRVSGGGTVLQGPGCLNYTLILRNGIDVPVGIGESFLFVLEHHKQCIRQMIGADVEIAGVSDLAISGRKFSGNAQYRKRRFALLHGTFLLDLDLRLVSRYLRLPTRQPAYRQNRPHTDFIQNLHVDSQKLSSRLRELWQASDYFADVPRTRIAELAEHRYNRPQWTRKF